MWPNAVSVDLYASNIQSCSLYRSCGADLSGWSPKYFPPILVRYANSLLKRKMLFGSDWPVIKLDRWLSDFEMLDIKPEVRPLILKENAVKLLGLSAIKA
jgi:uncharacterized protein